MLLMMEGLGIADYNCGTIAAGALFQYLHETQKSDLFMRIRLHRM